MLKWLFGGLMLGVLFVLGVIVPAGILEVSRLLVVDWILQSRRTKRLEIIGGMVRADGAKFHLFNESPTIELRGSWLGHSLVLSNSTERLVLYGNPSELLWVRDLLRAVQRKGDVTEVPEAIRGLRSIERQT